MDEFRVPIIFPDLFRQDRMVPMMKNHEAPGTIMTNSSRIMLMLMVTWMVALRQWNIPYGSLNGNIINLNGVFCRQTETFQAGPRAQWEQQNLRKVGHV
jgi:hypothetical protein